MGNDTFLYLRITETDGKTNWSIKLSLAQKYETSKSVTNICESPGQSSSNKVERYSSNEDKNKDLTFLKIERK